jgi:hypothetical protein
MEREAQEKANRGIRIVQAEPAMDYKTLKRTLQREEDQIKQFGASIKTEGFSPLRT